MNDTFLENIYKNKTLHTPDVLLCLANLSNDEVFTPSFLSFARFMGQNF